MHKQPTSTLSAVALPQNHLQIKHKYNSIDVGYDDQANLPQSNGDFEDAFIPKKTRTNTNISGQKRIMPSSMNKPNDVMRASAQTLNHNIYNSTGINQKKMPGR